MTTELLIKIFIIHYEWMHFVITCINYAEQCDQRGMLESIRCTVHAITWLCK